MSSARDILNPSRVGFNDGKYYSKTSDYFTSSSSIDDENCLVELLKDLKALYEDAREGKVGFDTLIKLSDDSGAQFPAHRQILTARSSLFEAAFNGEYNGFQINDTDVTEITLTNDFGPEATEYLMNYIYWGFTDDLKSEDFAKDIFKKASFLDLKELRRSVGDEIDRRFLNESNALDMLTLAEECGCKLLKKKVIDFIVGHKNAVTADDKWIQFASNKKNSELIKEIYKNDALKKSETKQQA